MPSHFDTLQLHAGQPVENHTNQEPHQFMQPPPMFSMTLNTVLNYLV